MEDNNKAELKLDIAELGNVSGGQYDPDEQYIPMMTAFPANLYSLTNYNNKEGSLQANQIVEVHPSFSYLSFRIVRVDGKDYLTEESNLISI